DRRDPRAAAARGRVVAAARAPRHRQIGRYCRSAAFSCRTVVTFHSPMVQVLILSHGALAHALVDTAERIVGRLADVQALSLDWDEPRESLLGRLHDVIVSIDEGEGVLILTDLFGDTPSNLALGLIEPGRVEVVTGVNLPMVLRLACVP